MTTPDHTAIGVGDRGDDVRRLQTALRLLGTDVPDAERAVGAFGTGTEEALRSWQASAYLEPSGVLDERTLDRLRAAADEQPRRSLFGRVTTPDGRGVGGAVVRAFDLNLDGPRPLGEAVTGDDGRFQIDYATAALGRPDKPAADLLVRAFASGTATEPLAETPVLFAADAVQPLHLVVPGDGPAAPAEESEAERLLRRVEPVLAGTPLEAVHDDGDVSFIAASTGVAEPQVRALAAGAALAAEAHTLTADGGGPGGHGSGPAEALTAPLLYGWVLDHPDADLTSLLAGTPEAIAGALQAAARNGMVPLAAVADGDGLVRAVAELKARHSLQPAGEGAVASVGDVLRGIPPGRRLDDAQERTVARLIAEGTAPGDALAERLAAAGFTERQVLDVRVAFGLDDLAAGDRALAGVLQSLTPPEHDGTLAHLASLTPNRWMEIVATAAAPDAGPDTEPDERLLGLPAAAAELSLKVERLHPSASLKARLDTGLFLGLRFPSVRVAAFLGDNPQFDIKDTDVEPFLVERGIDGDHELRTGLLTAQRLLRLGATQTELGVLLATGLTNAATLGLRDEQEVVTLLSESMPGARAAAIHANARHLLTATLAVATGFVPTLQPAAIPALAAPRTVAAPSAFPSVQQLFGDQSSCACGHCNSVLSPAAYLVDLLRLLDNAHVGQVLRQRRPDIAEVELTCANTNTTLPYVDLVLEILESAIAFPSPAVQLSPAERGQLDQGTVPGTVRDELVKHARRLRGDVTVETQAPESVIDEAPASLVIRNGTRRWPASRWQRRMSVRWTPIANIPFVLDVPDADIDATVQSLDAGQAPASLVAMIAPEPQAPVLGDPVVFPMLPRGGPRLPDSRLYRVTVVRSLLVQLIPGTPVGAVRLLRPDGTEIEAHNVQPGILVQAIAAELNAGRIHPYLGNFLPRLRFEIAWDAANSRWTLTSTVMTTVRFDPDYLVVDGLTYSGSSAQGDGEGTGAALFAENRDPEAYRRLEAAVYPHELPFDVFTEEVRACLAFAGTTRQSLLRTVRPSAASTSLDDACEVLGCAPAQARLLIETGATAARTAELWGLQETGNFLTDPDGGNTDPIPPDWVGALRRLSVLLDRAGVAQPTLLAILDTRYLRAIQPAPRLDPAFECRASRVTVADLGRDHLDRLQRFLRLQRITGWSVRDADLVVDALTRGGSVAFSGEAAARAVAHVRELSERLRVPVRHVAGWLGRFETTGYADREAGGTPTRPSGYDEIFRSPHLDGAGDADFQLAPGGAELAYVAALPAGGSLVKLTDRLGYLSAALHLGPTELTGLIGTGARAVVPDELTLANLLALYRQVSFARAVGLSVRDSRTLQLLAGVELFPQQVPGLAADAPSRRLLEFVDTVDAVRASGFTVEELAWCLDGAPADEVAAAGRRRDQLQWLAGLQDALRAVQPATAAQVPDGTLRGLLTAAGWPSPLQDRVLAGEDGQVGLASTPSLNVEFSAAAQPQVPASLPFTVRQTGPQRYVLRLTRTVTGADEATAFGALAQVSGLGPLMSATAPATRLRALWDQLQQAAGALVRWLQSVELPRVSVPLRFSIQAARDAGGPRALPAAGFGPWIRPAAAGDRLEIDGYLSAADARRLRAWALGATNEAAFRAEIDRITGVPAALGAPGAALGYDAAQRALVLVGYPSAADVAAFEATTDDPAFRAAVGQLVAASAAWVEQRPGRRVLGEQQVLDLFTGTQVPEERYARVHDALLTPVRRQVAARLAAARAGIAPRLFDALDSDPGLAAPPRDPLEALCSEQLLGVAIRSVGVEDAVREPLGTLDRIDRVGLLARKFQVQASEAPWLDAATGFQGLGALSLADGAAAAPAGLAAWRRAATLFRLRELVPGKGATLERVRTAATAADGVAAVERAFEVATGEAGRLLAVDTAVTQPAQLRDPLVLERVVNCALALRRLPVPAASLVQLCSGTLDQPAADTARGLVLAKLGTALAGDGAAPAAVGTAMDRLRDGQRRALVAYLVHRDGARDAADLHGRYLLDVETGPSARTGRIKQAISSTQLFVQRWLLNVEDPSLPSVPAALASQWEWTKSYRVWEANRRVFLYPENWLEPALRDDKTHLFTKLESELLQGDLTTDRAITLFENYLLDLHDLGQLTVRAMYREAVTTSTSVVHVLARSPDNPPKFFYRQWTLAETSRHWSPWEPVDSVTNNEHAVCFVHAGRPHIAWLQVGRAVDEGSAGSGDVANWDVELMWTFRTNEGWSAPKKWRTRIRHPVLLNKDERVSFALRVRDWRGAPQLRLYGARELGAAPVLVEPIPEFVQPSFTTRPKGVWTTSHRLQVQVVGQLDTTTGTKYIALDEASVQVWGRWFINYQTPDGQQGWGTGDPAWPAEAAPQSLTLHNGAAEATFHIPIDPNDVTAKYAYLYVRATVAGVPKTVGPINLDPIGNNEVRQGFRFPLSPNDPRFQASRPVRLVNIASFDWGSSLGLTGGPGDGTELAVDVPNAIHESSGFRENQTTAPLAWDGKSLTNPTNLVRFFAAASAGTDRAALGPPVYLEEAGFTGFFLRRADGTWALLPAAEYVAPDVLAVLSADRSVIRLGPQDTTHHRQALLSHIAATSDVSLTHLTGDAQFELPNAYSTYDWEVFFHVPFMVASALASQQRHAEALRWLHTIFDPTAARGTPAQAWIFKPFKDEPGGPGIDRLLEEFSAGKLDTGQADALRAQIEYWRANPFRPHGIARMRTRAYQWMVVYKYVDVLIAWADQLFKRDTIESLNEATQLYLLAAQLLGPKPRQAPEAARLITSPTYTALAGKWDDFANAWVSLADLPFFKAWLAFLQYLAEHGIVGPGQGGPDLAKILQELMSVGSLAFCVPPNDRTDAYRATVADRLRKIRSGQNIEGASRQLALFEPPIDPALLVRAVAAGLDIDTVLDDVSAPPSRYRFMPALQRAMEFTTEVRGLANSLLSALEKRDGEALSRMRAVDEVALLELTRATRQRELDEALANTAVIRQGRQSAALRYRHYQRLLGKDHIAVPDEQAQVALEAPRLQLAEAGSGQLDADLRGYGLTVEEVDQLGWLTVGNTYTLIGGGFQVASGIAHMVPNFSTKWFNEEVTFGGTNIGSGLGAVGQFFSMLSANASFQSSRSSIVAGHQRRYDDWILQSNLALRELEQIDRQLLAAEIRVDLARKALNAHDTQLENSRKVAAFMRAKFTNEQLYSWMADRLTEAHATAFDLAYDLAKRAEAALARELGTPRPGIVRSGHWGNLHDGLLAGELLAVDLRRLEAAYMHHDERELEITKHLPLSELDPVELLRLQTTGTCTFEVPETAFDMDFPGHYFRRVRSVSVSVPCVVGPYTSVAGTLTLLGSRTRVSAAAEPYPEAADDPRFVTDSGPVQSIATSTGQNDVGVFELDFNQERYLPFERCGAVSRWRFELPRQFRSFDYGTITDLVLHLRYTARDGGEPLRAAAAGNLRSLLRQASEAGSLVRTLSLRRDFPSEWHRLTRSPGSAQDVVIDVSKLPYAFRDADLSVWKVAAYVRYTGDAAGGGAGIVVSCPQPVQAGGFAQAPLDLEEAPSDIDGLARYDADLTAGTDVDPVPFGTGGAGSTWQFELAPEPRYHDIVLALWCANLEP